MLTQLSSTSTPPVVPPPCPAAKAASGASATASQTPPGTVPGVITDISAAARAAAERESSEALQTPSSSNVIFDFMSEAKGRAIELGGQALTTLRPTLEITTEIALDVTYLTELFLGNAIGTTNYFSKAEYVEKYDIGAALGYIRDYVRETAVPEERCATEPQGVNAIARETWNKVERWVDRLRGPKVEVLEHIAVGAAVGYALARIAQMRRG